MAPVTDFHVKEKYAYLNGFGSYHSSVLSYLCALSINTDMKQVRSHTRSEPFGQQQPSEATVWFEDGTHIWDIIHGIARAKSADMALPGDLLSRT